MLWAVAETPTQRGLSMANIRMQYQPEKDEDNTQKFYAIRY